MNRTPCDKCGTYLRDLRRFRVMIPDAWSDKDDYDINICVYCFAKENGWYELPDPIIRTEEE